MSKYTVELRFILDTTNIFDFEYSFVDEKTKEKLEQMFKSHYFFKEIGFETIARFKHYLKMTFQEKLEYYEMLMKTKLIEYDIKNNYDMEEKYTKENNSTVTNETSNNSSNDITSSSSNLNKYSDTPQSQINLSDNYITEITSNEDTGTTSNITQATGKNFNEGVQKETLTLTRRGNIGVMTGSDLIKKHIDLQKELNNIINLFFEKECNNLFMQIY